MASNIISRTKSTAAGRSDQFGRLVSLLAAVAAAACFVVVGIGERGGTGQEATNLLDERSTPYLVASVLSIYAAAGLCVAALRLGRRVGGDAGTLTTIAGVTVSFLMAAYYSTFAAGASVAELVLDDAGPGVGESSLVVLNVVEYARYAPGLLLLGAVLAASRRLPRAASISAGVLLVVAIVPFTTWMAAILVPVWLGVTGALAGHPNDQTG